MIVLKIAIWYVLAGILSDFVTWLLVNAYICIKCRRIGIWHQVYISFTPDCKNKLFALISYLFTWPRRACFNILEVRSIIYWVNHPDEDEES